MSHFTVTVCIDGSHPSLTRAVRVAEKGFPVVKDAVEELLRQALDPFDENKEIEPYRDYEEGAPEDYWWVSSIRKGAESWQKLQDKGAKALAAERLERHGTYDIDKAAEMVREHAKGWEKDSAWAARLNENPSWTDVVVLYNECFGSDDSEILYIDDSGRAYQISTYNPDSKWDWYQIGGRWPGRFTYRKEHSNTVITGERSWASEGDIVMPLHCDGGPKYALDLNAMREEAAAEARKSYAKYEAAVAGTPEALPWSTFTDNVSEGNGYTIERAREEYNTQPRIKALQDSRDFGPFVDNEDFACGEKLYIERARARAVPGWAMLTADGRWLAPGEMGWFGMSTDSEGSRIGYWETANAYIEALPDDAWLISVDCHI